MLWDISGENVDLGDVGKLIGRIDFLDLRLWDTGKQNIDTDFAHCGNGRIDKAIFILDEDRLQATKCRERLAGFRADVAVMASDQGVMDYHGIEMIEIKPRRCISE